MPDILVVDDEKAISRFFKALLEPDTCTVHGVERCEDALSLMEKIPMDAVVLDIHLSGKSGIDLLKKIRHQHKDLPVIMITGEPSVETAKNALHLGAFDYIEKPLKPDMVTKAIKQAIDSKSLFDEKQKRDDENRLHHDALKKKIQEQTQELEKSQRHLLHLEKMAAIGQLAAGVAHEINSPTSFVASNLNIMKGYIKSLVFMMESYRKLVTAWEHHPNLSGQAAEVRTLEEDLDIAYIMSDILALLDESEDGVSRIMKIVYDLKSFSHPGGDTPVFANVNLNIDITLNVVWNEMKYKVEVKKDYGDLPDISCYPQQLSQVFANILVNAAHAIEGKGVVTIRTRHVENHVEVMIKDTGVGIPEQNLARIFEPFFTTKDVGKGTGLGMHVAKSIIEKHHGSIRVESETGTGTTFTLTLPVQQP